MSARLTKILPPGGVSRLLSPMLNAMQKRTKVTWVHAKPAIEGLEHVGDHGTSAEAVSSMMKEGIKPAQTGTNFGGGSQGGPGLYLSNHPTAAPFFAANATTDKPGLLGQIVSFYRKQGAGQRVTMPSTVFDKKTAQRKFHAENASAHEMDLGPTRLPEEIRGTSSGSTTLLTEQAIKDEAVEYFAVPKAPLSKQQMDEIMSKLKPADAAKLAAWRKLSSGRQ